MKNIALKLFIFTALSSSLLLFGNPNNIDDFLGKGGNGIEEISPISKIQKIRFKSSNLNAHIADNLVKIFNNFCKKFGIYFNATDKEVILQRFYNSLTKTKSIIASGDEKSFILSKNGTSINLIPLINILTNTLSAYFYKFKAYYLKMNPAEKLSFDEKEIVLLMEKALSA